MGRLDLPDPPRDEDTAEPRTVERLSARETEVLQLASYGYTNQQISEQLGIAFETVRSHLKRIAQKLRTVDRTQAVAVALRAGMIS